VSDFADIEPNPARHRTVKLPVRVEKELVLPSANHVVILAALLAGVTCQPTG